MSQQQSSEEQNPNNHPTTPANTSSISSKYDEDAGVIKCICGFDDDDGFTIQCEHCFSWQHAQCVDITKENVPENYYCDKCSNRPVNPTQAKQRQRARIAEQQSSESSDKKGEEEDEQQQQQQQQQQTASELPPPPKPRRKRPPKVKSPDNSSSNNNNDEKKGRRLTEQNSKNNTAEEETIEPDARYFMTSACYRSYYVPITRCKIPSRLREYWQQLPDICKAKDDSTMIFSSKKYESTQPVKVQVKLVDSASSKTKFSGFSRFCVQTDSLSLSRDRFVLEFLGEVGSLHEYRANSINQYRAFGCPKPGVLAMSDLELVVDGRKFGSESSFLRRSCRPNVKFSPIIVDNEVRFAGFTVEPVKQNGELTIEWGWDRRHPAWRVFYGDGETFTNNEKLCLLKAYETVNQRGMDCACGSPAECLIAKMKRIGATAVSSESSVQPTQEYSAREERKIAARIEQVEKASKKRKSSEHVSGGKPEPESTRSTTTTTTTTEPERVQQVETRATQTEPVVKRLRTTSGGASPKAFVSRRGKLLARYAKVDDRRFVENMGYMTAAAVPTTTTMTTATASGTAATTATTTTTTSTSTSTATATTTTAAVPSPPYNGVFTKPFDFQALDKRANGSTTPPTPLSGPMVSLANGGTEDTKSRHGSVTPLTASSTNLPLNGSIKKKKLSLADYRKKRQQE